MKEGRKKGGKEGRKEGREWKKEFICTLYSIDVFVIIKRDTQTVGLMGLLFQKFQFDPINLPLAAFMVSMTLFIFSISLSFCFFISFSSFAFLIARDRFESFSFRNLSNYKTKHKLLELHTPNHKKAINHAQVFLKEKQKQNESTVEP